MRIFAFIFALLITTSAQAKDGISFADDPLGWSCLRFSTFTLLTSELTTRPGSFLSAKNDALAFVGSDGEIRGAYFEQALLSFRSTGGNDDVSDAQFAEAVAVIQ
ncbi:MULTISPECIES: DUF2388 domain-containing protein [unclassified Pseudomonas]|uniref:DUF2388 domain-containing protein n=1 Tax=unclassified Pseudomonas TaxID=196821 RepID=UPI00028A2EA6|nr:MULTISPECIES: DUF2388 domain-containing protein [unclassified Pseudomonas]QJI37601.1 DUF2388 domain-containing protein [Pseudomonas sp. ADAK13]